jgi:hypothetical protein
MAKRGNRSFSDVFRTVSWTCAVLGSAVSKMSPQTGAKRCDELVSDEPMPTATNSLTHKRLKPESHAPSTGYETGFVDFESLPHRQFRFAPLALRPGFLRGPTRSRSPVLGAESLPHRQPSPDARCARGYGRQAASGDHREGLPQ